MNIVYKLTFNERKRKNILPYYYIGSKSNCYIKDGVIYGANDKPYFGSSSWENYDILVENDDIQVDILFSSDEYEECLREEAEMQRQLNVVVSEEYFNKVIANTKSNYTNPEYATYKHKKTGKRVRLRRDDPHVLNGTFVGITHGVRYTEEERKKRSIAQTGEKNPFFGKKHSDETREKIKQKLTGLSPSEETRLKMSLTRKGRKKAEDHKKKIGRKGLRMIKNLYTEKCIRVPMEEEYDPDIWVHPGRFKKIMRDTQNMDTNELYYWCFEKAEYLIEHGYSNKNIDELTELLFNEKNKGEKHASSSD